MVFTVRPDVHSSGLKPALVRPQAHVTRVVRVHSPGDACAWEANRNCVVVRRGGEQQEAKDQSVG